MNTSVHNDDDHASVLKHIKATLLQHLHSNFIMFLKPDYFYLVLIA